MNRNILFLLFFLLLTQLTASAKSRPGQGTPKDTLLLMNGGKLACTVVDTAFHKLKVTYTKKHGKEKTVVIDNDLVFSVLYHNGVEHIIYEQDTLTGNYFSADETKMFIFGERDAEKYFRSPVATVTSIMIGVGSGYVGNFLCLIPPFVYSGLLVIPKIKIKYKGVSNPVYLNYDTYVMGYEKVGRRKKLFRSLIGGFGGLAAGIATFQLAFPNL